VIGVDMTRTMLERARQSATRDGFGNVELHESLIEALPLDDASVDVVISNGVIDLVPTRTRCSTRSTASCARRPAAAGRRDHPHEVSEDARSRIDLWTG
jgi:2-polyprenyl-3-methyl-5-hydroxy-6-metoxy-1,4-benzoquinol methylase